MSFLLGREGTLIRREEENAEGKANSKTAT